MVTKKALARQYPNTRFIKIFVENANFLVERLKIRVLPCVVCFVDAVTVDKCVFCVVYAFVNWKHLMRGKKQ